MPDSVLNVCGCVPPCGFPPCINCGEDHGSSPGGRCRDCDIQWLLQSMHCTGCDRMRYRTETPLGNIGEYLWGEPCVCDPKPPTVAEQNS